MTNNWNYKYAEFKIRNISPYYMMDTDGYDLIEDVEFIDVLDELEPKLLKIFKTKFKVKLELIKLITEVQ